MESLVCKAAKCTPHMALNTSFSLEATLDSPCSWTSICFDTPHRRVSCQGMPGCPHSPSLGNIPYASRMEGGECSPGVVCAAAQHSQAWTALAPSACEAGTDSLQQWQAQPCRRQILPLWALSLPCWGSGGAISGSPGLSVFKAKDNAFDPHALAFVLPWTGQALGVGDCCRSLATEIPSSPGIRAVTEQPRWATKSGVGRTTLHYKAYVTVLDTE